MERARACREDVPCPHCGSSWVRKDGHSRGKQMCECRGCGRKHQEGAKRFSDADRDLAVNLCMDGSSLSAAGRAVGASATSVGAWIEKKGPRRSLR